MQKVATAYCSLARTRGGTLRFAMDPKYVVNTGDSISQVTGSEMHVPIVVAGGGVSGPHLSTEAPLQTLCLQVVDRFPTSFVLVNSFSLFLHLFLPRLPSNPQPTLPPMCCQPQGPGPDPKRDDLLTDSSSE